MAAVQECTDGDKEGSSKLIISASRRTDIPAFYSDWFLNRIRAGYAFVRNPMNVHQVSKVSLDRGVVDCVVFWTKNPGPLLPSLHLLREYQYYFQFTLNPYDVRIEPRLPEKSTLVETFKRLSDTVGPHRVIWRYDPVMLGADFDITYHEKQFAILASSLEGYSSKCIISFVDFYKKVEARLKALRVVPVDESQKRIVALRLATVARSYGLTLETCAEDIATDEFGIEHARCIDPVLIQGLLGARIKVEKDKNQRDPCGCVASIDIGMYNTCRHGCRYCYANFSQSSIDNNVASYRPESPLLCSELTNKDKVSERECKSCVMLQRSLID